jgi:hypothetical protein
MMLEINLYELTVPFEHTVLETERVELRRNGVSASWEKYNTLAP